MASDDYVNFRLRGIPQHYSCKGDIQLLVKDKLHLDDETGIKIHSLASSPSRFDFGTKVATLSFRQRPVCFLDLAQSPWNIDNLTFDTDFHGFTPLNDWILGDFSADYIAVSGLDGHAFGSFKRRKGSFMWLRDALPHHFPEARILVYGCDTQLQQSVSIQNMEDLGDHLRMALRTLKRENPQVDQRIVLLGHSLGGLVIKEAMILMKESKSKADRLCLKSIRGILFFGVPHQGMEIKALTAMVQDQPNRSLLETLRKNSVLLRRHEREFPKVQTNLHTLIAFYETQESPTAEMGPNGWKLSGPPAMLVDVSSATFGCHHSHPIDRNHSDLVKFHDQYDPYYAKVLVCLDDLNDLMREISDNRDEIESIDDDDDDDDSTKLPTRDEKRGCLQSLAFKEQSSRRDELKPAPRTCDWFLQDEVYLSWINSDRSLLWVQGKPGAGKSTIIKRAIAIYEGQPLSRTEALKISFFFHAQGSMMQKSPLGLFRSLLNDTLEHFPDFWTDLAKRYRVRTKRMGDYQQGKWEWTEAELREFLERMLPVASRIRPIIIYVDALDECGEEAATGLVTYFSDLIHRSNETAARLKICFSCRHYPILNLDDGFTIFVERKNDQDIHRVVANRLREMKVSEVERQKIENEIVAKSQGIFQWATIVVTRAIQLSRTGVKVQVILKKIQEIPSQLNELYETLLRDIGHEERRQTAKLFQWICFAQTPLTIGEVRYAMALDSLATIRSMEELEETDYFSENAHSVELSVKHLSRGLIEIAGTNESNGDNVSDTCLVQFIHQTVPEFLLRKGFAFLQAEKLTGTPTGDAHFNISRSCVQHLNFWEVIYGDAHTPAETLKMFPLLAYAVSYMPRHIQQVEKSGFLQLDLLEKLPWRAHPSFSARFSAFLEALKSSRLDDTLLLVWPSKGSTIVHYIAALGVDSALESLITAGEQSIDATDSDGNTPFSLAIMNRHETTALRILSTGSVSLNRIGTVRQTSPLHLAVLSDIQEVVCQLLDRGANANMQSIVGFTPLHIAAAHGNAQITRMLVERRANQKDNPQEDAAEGNTAVDIDLPDQKGRSPLALAIEQRSFWASNNVSSAFNEIAHSLISIGNADPNLEIRKETQVRSLLAQAAFNGNEELVRILSKSKRIKWDFGGHDVMPSVLERRAIYEPNKLLIQVLINQAIQDTDH